MSKGGEAAAAPPGWGGAENAGAAWISQALPSAWRGTLQAELDAGRGFLWLPVAFGSGILGYFALPVEPPLILLVLASAGLFASALAWRDKPALRRCVIFLCALIAGATAATVRTDIVAAPRIPRDMTVTVSGWIIATEETAGSARRIRIAVADIAELAPAATPRLVRITVRAGAAALAVGDAVTVLAGLAPPAGPVMPGGYDFSLAPYYAGIGGIGFAFGAAKPADLGPMPLAVAVRKPLADLRETIRRGVVAALPGDNGEIAAALIMGDQRGISDDTQEAMRASGLGHILSISGLHLALIAGSVFWIVRALLALSRTLALRHSIKKWAAAAALGVATFYLGISGAEVATVRSYVMLAIMLVAVLLDRKALTLRNIALAALAILVVSPESLLSISFQMSFAATVALVAAYEWIAARRQRREILRGTTTWPARAGAALLALFLTSLIAGVATAPFGAFYFHRIAPLTIVANMAVAPVVGFVVMPMVLLTVLALPFGMEAWPLAVMGLGLDWMVAVAIRTAAWSEGWGGVRAPTAAALLLMTAGFLWLALWKLPWRVLGVVPILVAIPVTAFAPRPVLIVDEDASAVAVRAADGRLRILGGRGADFEIETWLRADGDQRTPEAGDLKAGVACDPIGCVTAEAIAGNVALVLRRDAFEEDCRYARVLISALPAPPRCADFAELVIDRDALDRHGAHALYLDDEKLRVETAYPAHRRPFMPPGAEP